MAEQTDDQAEEQGAQGPNAQATLLVDCQHGQHSQPEGRACGRSAWHGPDFGLMAMLYLAGQSLPVGGFAWSQGLAAAVERGHAGSAEGVRRWLWGVLRLGLARNDLPLLLRMHAAAA